MKKVVLFLSFLTIFLCTNSVSADSNYVDDYTLIDCVNGDDATGVAFDSEKPYQTLKGGIERTVAYINSNVNKVGNEENAKGLEFKIQVNCSMNSITGFFVSIPFDGKSFDNSLLIEGTGENSLIFSDITFLNSGNKNMSDIIIKNANFIYSNRDFLSGYTKGISVYDSVFSFKNGKSFAPTGYFEYYRTKYYNSNNSIRIYNSIINYELNTTMQFFPPALLKNSKINFTAVEGKGPFTINFTAAYSDWRDRGFLDFFVLIGNEIDFGGNSFITKNINTNNALYLNNKFSNFSNFIFSGQELFLNNLIENTESIDISVSKNLYNNVFSAGFTDSYDIYNLRKNYHIDNIGPKGVAWVVKKRGNYYHNINIDTSSKQLYKEATGQDIPDLNNSVYVIYQ